MSIRLPADAELDLLTIDGSGGGTGMSPWNMMEHWGVPSLHLHSKAYEYCKLLADAGITGAGHLPGRRLRPRRPPLQGPGAVCAVHEAGLHGPGADDPGLSGLATSRACSSRKQRQQLNGHWDELPETVTDHRQDTRGDLRRLGGRAEQGRCRRNEEHPLRRRSPCTATPTSSPAGCSSSWPGRASSTSREITRDDLMAANAETAEITGLAQLTEAQDDVAKKILKD